MRVSRLLLVLAVPAALAVLSCGGNTAGEPGPYKNAPIILISVDTLRSDHLPAYGYDKVKTPAFDAFLQDAVLFERAYSHVPLTLPSHATILSGRLPGEHGVRDNSGYVFSAAKTPYLPKLLHDAGYKTGAAVSTFVLRAETGMAEGFDSYESNIEVRATESLGNSQRSGRETSRVALDWLKTVSAQPFFLFFHLYEPHTPYAPEPAFASYADPYDGEVATADAILGDFLAELKTMGVYDKAVIVLLSDHGEGLRDHGEQEHGIFLYREALQVPLMIKLPKGERGGSTVKEPAQLIDVFPTILGLAGLPAPAGLQGHPLFSLSGERTFLAETFYPRLHLGWSELHSAIRGGSHYIEAPEPELYDLAADPAEKTNVLTRERRTYAELRKAVDAARAPLVAPSAEDAETTAKLASLGYLGSSVNAGDGPLPDPKAKIHTLDDFGRALSLAGAQRYAEAVPLFQQLVKDNPFMLDSWESLGQSLQKLGRHQEALAAYEQAMKVSNGAGHVALSTASLLLDMGRLDDARKHAEIGLPTSPAVAHNLLAQIALAKNDTATAEKEARAALAARGSRLGPLVTLAGVLEAQGKLDEALKLTDDALAEMKPGQTFTGLYLIRGDLFGRMNRAPEAEQAFLHEIRDFPADTSAYTRLAVLYASLGRPAEAVNALRSMVETQNSPAAYIAAVKTLRILGDPQGAAALLRHAIATHPDSQELRALAG
ncbi:MAG TPA: sulfatase-like hydrolase/transferase [Thermoanaerobaculia bacterium]|jgi:arylsulfatase A-like enzyme/Flp pilus assembly protein TadD|nr:sulfatase-like hydrolase/transferase [Thermoanaerobaculia bacterium]